MSQDVDASNTAGVRIPTDLMAEFIDDQGRRRAITFDANFSMGFDPALDYRSRFVETLGNLEIRILDPHDLVCMKAARWAPNDIEDVEALARSGVLDLATLSVRADEAAMQYYGNDTEYRANLDAALDIVRRRGR